MLFSSFLLHLKAMFCQHVYRSDDWLYGSHFPFGHRMRVVAEALSWHQAEAFSTSQILNLFLPFVSLKVLSDNQFSVLCKYPSLYSLFSGPNSFYGAKLRLRDVIESFLPLISEKALKMDVNSIRTSDSDSEEKIITPDVNTGDQYVGPYSLI